jgi:hypothetical protein
MTATNPRDRETVRSLLRQHLPSGFPQPLAPLTIGDIACHVYNEWQMGRQLLFVWEKPLADRLLTATTPLPVALTDASVGAAIAEALGSEPAPSFVGLFRTHIDALIQERARNLVLPHLRAF